jgi:GNAT superfamily N-acetyltransferase
VATRLHLEGDWPDLVSIRRGWARATARPWNDDVPDISLRLFRGGADFLAQATDAIRTIHQASVFSPALYSANTKIWKRVGYEVHLELPVLERSLISEIGPIPAEVTEAPPDQIDQLVDIDREAFDGFWRMAGAGITEALRATPKVSVLVTTEAGELTGYALIGTQLSVSFLQRVAVLPDKSGQGLGTALVRSSLIWGRRHGAKTMVLNLKPDNDRARSLYERMGFVSTGTTLNLLEYKG